MTQNFPKLLSSQIAFDIARTILDGFDKHFRIFRQISCHARTRFEQGQFDALHDDAVERIDYYDLRVRECITALESEYIEEDLTDEVWREVKLHYMGLLANHRQPELAETFFNSVCCKILHRAYFHNDFIFVRPAISTEYIEPLEGVIYRSYLLHQNNLREVIRKIVLDFNIEVPFLSCDADIDAVLHKIEASFAHRQAGQLHQATSHQIHIYAHLFFRGKSAYIVGRIFDGEGFVPLVLPLTHETRAQQKGIIVDTVLLEPYQISTLFSFTRAYFMVDMDVPSSTVHFLRSLMPAKAKSEIYTMLGLQKQGKTLFYRDFQTHLAHSTDQLGIAPGIKGLVMLVFSQPSFPYVFKMIKDSFPPPKETTRELIKSKYLLVKRHDRVGRMADTLEYSNVALPRTRFSDELIEEIQRYAPSNMTIENDEVILHHLYIERRMMPLNIFLSDAQARNDDSAIEHGLKEYGQAIRDLIQANIFPGDMLYKNFGVTRHGRVVFYDYDEIEYLTECNFREIPQPRNEEDEMASEPWYHIAKNDVFPEQFEVFLLSDPKLKSLFKKHHQVLLEAQYWRTCQEHIQKGQRSEARPYPDEVRFSHHIENIKIS